MHVGFPTPVTSTSCSVQFLKIGGSVQFLKIGGFGLIPLSFSCHFLSYYVPSNCHVFEYFIQVDNICISTSSRDFSEFQATALSSLTRLIYLASSLNLSKTLFQMSIRPVTPHFKTLQWLYSKLWKTPSPLQWMAHQAWHSLTMIYASALFNATLQKHSGLLILCWINRTLFSCRAFEHVF